MSLLLAASLAGGGAMAAGDPLGSPEQANQWVMFYYQHPDPLRLPELVTKWGDWLGGMESDGDRQIAQFVAEAARGQGAELPRAIWNAAAERDNERTRRLALQALAYLDSEAAREVLRDVASRKEMGEVAAFAESLSGMPPLPLEQQAPTAGVLDRWWAAFFATGELETVRLIAQQAHMLDTGSGMEVAVGGAASWSLASNAARHPKVRTLLVELAADAEGQRAKRYREILKKADEYEARDDQPGQADSDARDNGDS